jgi:hypothetical protein
LLPVPQCVPRPGDRCRVSRFFNALVRKRPARLARLCVQASAAQCIRLGRRLRERVPWELAQGCRPRERRVRAVDLAVHRADRVNGMCHVG